MAGSRPFVTHLSRTGLVKNFATANHVQYPLVLSTRALAASFPALIGLPTTYVVDQQGRIVKKHVGQPGWTAWYNPMSGRSSR